MASLACETRAAFSGIEVGVQRYQELLQEAVQLAFLRCAERREQLAFTVGAGSDVLVQFPTAGPSECHEDASAVLRIPPALQQARAFELVQPIRHRTCGNTQLSTQRAMRSFAAGQNADHLVFLLRESHPAEAALGRFVEIPSGSGDTRHDALHLRVDLGPPGERELYVCLEVGVAGGSGAARGNGLTNSFI